MAKQRLIDANALREAILEERKHIREEEYEIKKGFMLGGLRRALRCLEEAPTVERPRMEWWRHRESRTGGCSECKFITDIFNTGLWNFCPNCGADMRGERE